MDNKNNPVILPERVRSIKSSKWAWWDRRLFDPQFPFLSKLRPTDFYLYGFYATVGDRNGVSYYSISRQSEILGLDRVTIIRSRKRLEQTNLIASKRDRFNRNKMFTQVLSLPIRKATLEQIYKPERPSHQEMLSLAKNIVDSFYKELNLQSPVSKKEKGYKICVHLLEEGYKFQEIKFAVEWAKNNVERIYSFAIIPEVIDQAIAEKKQGEERTKLQNEIEAQQKRKENETRKQIELEQQIEKIKGRLPKKDIDDLRKRADEILSRDPTVNKRLGYNTLVEVKTDQLIYDKFVKKK